MADPMDFFAALSEGLATCSALAGERPVRDVEGTDVTDELLANPDASLARMEWALTEMQSRVADGRATSNLPISAADIERVRRLRQLIADRSPDAAAIAKECTDWWDGMAVATA